MYSKYLALGDSITAGFGDDVGDLTCRSWAQWLAEGLAATAPGIAFENLAASGATAIDVLRDQVPEIEVFQPDLVSVTVGANDARVPEWTAEDFRSNYASILQAAADADARIITGTYPDIEASVLKAGGKIRDSWRLYFDRMHEVNAVIREVSGTHGTCLIEMETPEASDPRFLSRDFTHPNALAYRWIGEVALGLLTAPPP